MSTIDALFGSKTRVKLLHLFTNNPDKAFYVREITRLIDEQINSVRRELSNMLEVGVITCDSSNNKLYYQVNHLYEFYSPFKEIFAEEAASQKENKKHKSKAEKWQMALAKVSGLKLAVAAGSLISGSASPVDLLLVGSISAQKAKSLSTAIEKQTGKSLNYSLLSYDEFYYRLSVRDKFINEILSSQYKVLLDVDNVLKSD